MQYIYIYPSLSLPISCCYSLTYYHIYIYVCVCIYVYTYNYYVYTSIYLCISIYIYIYIIHHFRVQLLPSDCVPCGSSWSWRSWFRKWSCCWSCWRKSGKSYLGQAIHLLSTLMDILKAKCPCCEALWNPVEQQQITAKHI